MKAKKLKSNTAKLGKNRIWLALPAFIALFSIFKIWPVLPAVMQDEYIYSTQSRFVAFADQLYPNYLFSFVYSSTNMCGAGFYDCAKSLNAIFFIGTLAIIWLITKNLFGNKTAIFISSIGAISPISIYVSYFMPESMYYFFMTLTIWLALRASQNSIWQTWSLVALGLGAASLVKPHAIFVLPAIVLFGLITAARASDGTWKKAIAFQANLIGAFFALKFGLGFAFAGKAGLTIFGGSYQSTIDNFVNNVSQPLAAASSIFLTEPRAPKEDNLGIFWAVASSQLFAQLCFYLLLAGVPLVLSLRNSAKLFEKRDAFDAKTSLAFLIAVITVSLVIVVALFEGVVSALGDNHSNRMLLRYSEFLLPFLALLGFLVMQNYLDKFGIRFLCFLAVALGIIYAAAWIPINTELHFSDSNTLAGLLSQPWIIWCAAFLALVGISAWLFNQEKGGKIIAWAIVPSLIAISGIAGQAELLNRVGTEKAYFDIAGQKARVIFDTVKPSEILIVGNERQQVFTTKFWIDKPNLRDIIVEAGKILNPSELSDSKYLVLVGNVELASDVKVIDQGDGYAIVQLAN